MSCDRQQLKPAAPLFPLRRDRESWDDRLTRELALADDRVAKGPVTPVIDLASFKKELESFDFCAARPLGELLSWTIDKMECGLVHVTHPRYFGLFNPAPAFPAQCADRIAAAFNPQLATATTSPVAVAIESHVIQAVARRAGFPPEAAGHFTSGGSEANYTALLCALTRSNAGFAADGARAFAGPPIFYISKESHLAWIKIAHQAGIGRSAARIVDTDGFGRMDTAALEDALSADRSRGCVPVMIVATAGTTNAGMIDPLGACAEIARRHGLWHHADAAWGGALIASDHLRGVLNGLEQADSVTIDAHKWFATTMGCGMFITKHPGLLSSAFQVQASFMPSNIHGVDPYVTSVQWSRRFLG
ncbi:MAG: pyridoxal-dependent decarboxylase, partial [Candidatus Binataceae bacterium]